jgi:hypothetical protein
MTDTTERPPLYFGLEWTYGAWHLGAPARAGGTPVHVLTGDLERHDKRLAVLYVFASIDKLLKWVECSHCEFDDAGNRVSLPKSACRSIASITDPEVVAYLAATSSNTSPVNHDRHGWTYPEGPAWPMLKLDQSGASWGDLLPIPPLDFSATQYNTLETSNR